MGGRGNPEVIEAIAILLIVDPPSFWMKRLRFLEGSITTTEQRSPVDPCSSDRSDWTGIR